MRLLHTTSLSVLAAANVRASSSFVNDGSITIQLDRRIDGPSMDDPSLLAPVNTGPDYKPGDVPEDLFRALRIEVFYAEEKLLQGFAAYKKHAGFPHPLSVEATQPENETAIMADHSSGTATLRGYSKVVWSGSIKVGNPSQEFFVDFDTGSSDFLLPGRRCDQTCDGHSRYDPERSQDARRLNKRFDLRYGDGSHATGDLWTDTVTFGGNLRAVKQVVGAANSYQGKLTKNDFPPDGILGLAFPSISRYEELPVFHSFLAQGQAKMPVFAFKLSEQSGELRMGDVNPALFKQPVTYTPVQGKPEGFWQVAMDGIVVGQRRVLGSAQAVIDTGTSLILGDERLVQQFYTNVPGSQQHSSGFYFVPCRGNPAIRLSFGKVAFKLDDQNFVLSRRFDGALRCVGAIVPSRVASQFWLIGDAFLQGVYSIFDVQKKQVGFAELT